MVKAIVLSMMLLTALFFAPALAQAAALSEGQTWLDAIGPGFSPAYGYYGTPAYSTYGPAYSGYSYGYAPYGGTYYGAPAAGVGVYPGTAAVRVGPLGIGWR